MRFLLLILFLTPAFSHPHHHSLAIFDYNKNSQQMELSLKILAEDFVKINKDKKAHIYLRNHLKIELNSHPLNARFQGSEKDHEFMWFYYSFNVELSAKNNIIDVTNTILKNKNDNQFNTVKITLFKQVKAHNFLFSENNYTFIFD